MKRKKTKNKTCNQEVKKKFIEDKILDKIVFDLKHFFFYFTNQNIYEKEEDYFTELLCLFQLDLNCLSNIIDLLEVN